MLSFPPSALRLAACLALLAVAPVALADDWPQWLGPQRDGVWRETGIIDKFPEGGPKVLWRQDIGGGYCGPSVVGGKVYVLDRVLAPGAKDPDNPFNKTDSKGEERLLCLDQKTGKILWKYTWPSQYQISYAAGPRATPTVDGGKVYALGAMGDFVCVEAASGKFLWKKSLVEDYGAPVQIWGFAAHPLVVGDRVITLLGGKAGLAVAFDKNTGEEKWKAPATRSGAVGYAPPTLIEAGGKKQVILWNPDAVTSVDPDNGNVLWSEKWMIKSSLSVPTPRQVGDKLFLTSFYNGSLLLKLSQDKPGASVVWKSEARGENPSQTTDLSSIMPAPYVVGEHVYGVCSYGELRCLELATGKRVWEDLTATGSLKKGEVRWGNAFLTPQGNKWFVFNEKGDLIIAKLSPKGYEEVSRAHVIEPTSKLAGGSRAVVWSHPAYAGKCAFIRNDKEIICVSLAAE